WKSPRSAQAAGPSTPPHRWQAWRSTGRWSCRRRWRATAWSMPTALGSGPGRGCWRPCGSLSPSGWRPGPTPSKLGAATPSTTGGWLSRRTGRCAARARTSGWSGCGPGGANRAPPGGGTWPTAAGRRAAAVRWYLAHDRGPLPRLFRVLWLFWTRRDREREARPWVGQLLPAAGRLDAQARAELAWVAAVLAVDTGDDTAVLAAREP